jgi:CubicO group peptidase (beta-lactamase class C family)
MSGRLLFRETENRNEDTCTFTTSNSIWHEANKIRKSIESQRSIEMKKRKLWFWMIGGVVLLIAGLFAAGLLGRLPWQSGNLYEDPQGRFTMQVDRAWEQVETDGSYPQFKVADPPMDMYLLVLPAGTLADAFSQTMQILGFDPALLVGGGTTTLGDWEAYAQEDRAGLMYGLAGQTVGENSYVFMVKANQPGINADNPVVVRALTGVKIAGKEDLEIKSFAEVEAVVREQVDSLAGSVSIALVHKGEIVYTYAYGEANPVDGIAADTGTIYAFGSMTKPFTATALMQLVEQGKVDLDAWPGEYIPEFPESWSVTVRQLLDHSACMPGSDLLTDGLIVKPEESFAPLEEIFTTYVKDYPDLVCEPGKVSNYSNPHFLALGRIIEEVSGEPFETYVVDHILTPLGMESTRFQLVEADERYAKEQFPAAQIDGFVAEVNEYRGPGQEALVLQKGEAFATLDDYRILPPWGGLRGTPSDVTHFLQMHMNKGRYGDIQILKPESVAAMQEMQTSIDGSPLGFGLSWWLKEDRFGEYIGHNGSTAVAENVMRFYPDLDLGVVVMANIPGYRPAWIAEGLVGAWMHER